MTTDEDHQNCRFEIALLTEKLQRSIEDLNTQKAELAAQQSLIEKLESRLRVLEINASFSQAIPLQNDISPSAKYALYAMDSPESPAGRASCVFFPGGTTRIRGRNNSLTPTPRSQFNRRNSAFSPTHPSGGSCSSLLSVVGVRSYSHDTDDSSISESGSPSLASRRTRTLTIDTGDCSGRFNSPKLSEHILVPSSTDERVGDETKEEHKRVPSIVLTEVPANFRTSQSYVVPTNRARSSSLNLFRSAGLVEISSTTSSSIASFDGDLSFGDYVADLMNTTPRNDDGILSPPSPSFPSTPAAVKAVRTDQQEYEDLAPARNLLVASLGLHNLGASPSKLESSREWLERFLLASGQEDLSQRNKLLLDFSKDFIRQATTRARIILQEVHVPMHLKSIPPLKMGGMAGGTKYLDQNILFKFADDPAIGEGKHLYGGEEADHERAGKAAANDLKGADAYFRCFALMGRIPIVVPPQVVMDFNGFRLVAMPWLPLKEARLVYGSSDGGKTVYDDDEVMQAAMKFAAHHLHLVKHVVKDKMLYSAGDVEAHVGKDGRRYLVDLGRTFPPEDPTCCSHLSSSPSAVFFRLHRTAFMEYLKFKQDLEKYPALSSDAFSKWADKQDAQIHNDNASHATKLLLSERIPELLSFLNTQDNMTQNLGQVMQRWGISVRHMGLVRAKARETHSSEALLLQLLVNMVARSCKNLLRQDLREAALAKNVNDSIAAFLNALTGCGEKEESVMFWGVKLPKDLTRRFGTVALVEAEESQLQALCKPSVGSILKYVLAQTGVTLNADTQAWQQPNFFFSRLSILSTSVRSKTFSVLEDLLQDDNIVYACECKTRNDFFSAATKLSRKASEALAYLLNIISEAEELMKYFQTRVGRKGQDVQLLIMCALALFFSDKPYPEKIRALIANSTEVWAVILAMVPKLPQIFSPSQQQELMTAHMCSLCESDTLSPRAQELAQALLGARANPNARLETKDLLLHVCVMRGHTPLVEALVEAKADLNIMDSFGHTLEQIIFSYCPDASRMARMLGIKQPSTTHLLPSVRFRVHTLRAPNVSNFEGSGATKSTFCLKLKLEGAGIKFKSTAPIIPMTDRNSSKYLPVYAEYFFDEWPQECGLKCIVYRGKQRAASVVIDSRQHGFYYVHAPMKSKIADIAGLVLVGDILISPPRVLKTNLSTPESISPGALTRMGSAANLRSLYQRRNSWSFGKSFRSKDKPERLRRGTSDPSDMFKAIILGTTESGKSTLFKRLRGPLLSEDIPNYIDIIRRNVITGVQRLIMASAAKLHALLPVNERSVAYVANFDVYELNPQDVSEVLPHLQAVLSDPGIQRTLLDRSALQMVDARHKSPWNVNDTVDHFFSKLKEVFASNYVPTQLDCLACRMRSVGAIEHKVFMECGTWRVLDVGGTRNERRKWPNFYEGVDAVIFTVDITSYDRVSEDVTTNRLLESVMVWETVISSEALSHSCFVLMFTCNDKLASKLHGTPISKLSFLANLLGSNPSAQEARDHISRRFLQHSKLSSAMLKVVFVNLLNDISYDAAFQEIEQFFCSYTKVAGMGPDVQSSMRTT